MEYLIHPLLPLLLFPPIGIDDSRESKEDTFTIIVTIPLPKTTPTPP